MHQQILMLLVNMRILFILNLHALILWVVAVAAHLALYKFTLKTDPPSAFKPDLKQSIPEQLKFEPLTASKEWDAGTIAAKAQNLARTVRSSAVVGSLDVDNIL